MVHYNLSTPEDVENLEVSNIADTSAVISFTPKENATLPSEKYKIYLNNQLITTTTEHNYTFTNLNKGTTYNVRVESVNADGVASLGKSITFSTLKPTEEAQFIEKYKSAITNWITRVEQGKSLSFQTQFAYLYSIRTGLTNSQKVIVSNYYKKIKLIVISSNSTSSYVKATNLNKLKSKKTTTITFGTTLKPSTLTSSKISIMQAGKKITGFKLKKDTKYLSYKLNILSTL